MISIMKRFFDFCSKDNRNKFYRSLIDGLFMAIANGMKYPAAFLIIGAFVSGNITGKTIWIAFLIMLGSIIFESIIRSRSVMLQCKGGYRECANKRIEIAEHLRFLPMGYFNETSLGEITAVTTNIMEQLGDIATRVIMMTSQGILNSIVIIALIMIFDYRIGLIALCGVAFFAIVNHMMQVHNIAMSHVKHETDTAMVAGILEYVQGITEVKAYNVVGSSRAKLDETIRTASKVNTDLELSSNRYIPVQNIILKLTGVAIFLASIYFYLQGSMSITVVAVMGIMSFHVFAPLEQMGAYSSLLKTVDIAVARASAILALEPMDIDGEDFMPESRDIEVMDVDFAYDKKKIIDAVSFSIKENQTVAFVGPSGGGKTTLCHLVARFWDVDRGQITLGGKDLTDYSMNSLMSNYSFVFQNVYLFHDTIANNIRFGRPEAGMDKVIAVAKKSCCHDFIMSLPDGYDTVIGEKGATLSGGERQRLSIARAMMKDAPIIILDEATANVDPENEKELMDAIAELTKEKTILMIAHRLKTVQHADRIFVVDKGRIVQSGTHRELMETGGIYKSFVETRKQSIGWKLG